MIELRVREPMLDLGLLRVPTFNGGLVAAWAVSASIFSLLTYLVIYMQNLLGYSALDAGLRFLPLTGGVFLVAGIAGRLTTKVPIRLLIGTGFAFVVAGLLLMRGLTPADSWTHFLPGLHPRRHRRRPDQRAACLDGCRRGAAERAGMASGINSTLRQVGIATGVAALGTILASQIKSDVVSHLSGTPLAAHAHALGTAISSGGLARRCPRRPRAVPGPARSARPRPATSTRSTRSCSSAPASPSSAWSSRSSTIRQRDFQVDSGARRDPRAAEPVRASRASRRRRPVARRQP